MTRLALVDDHELFRSSVASALVQRGFSVVAQAADARSSFPLIAQSCPDIVLFDIGLPGMDGITATREILSRRPAPRVMLLTAYDSPGLVTTGFEAGALGYALKSQSIETLVRGIDSVSRGERFAAPGLQPGPVNGLFAQLTPRERDIFNAIVQGQTSRETAKELCISIKTIETHRQRIFQKLNVHSAVQVVRFAVVNDLLVPRSAGGRP